MTREDAITLAVGEVGMDYIEGVEKAVNKIYDDFESRKCENCIYGEPFANTTYSMVTCELNDEKYPKTYGCIDFEREEK